jgi:hypothetical protein
MVALPSWPFPLEKISRPSPFYHARAMIWTAWRVLGYVSEHGQAYRVPTPATDLSLAHFPPQGGADRTTVKIEALFMTLSRTPQLFQL